MGNVSYENISDVSLEDAKIDYYILESDSMQEISSDEREVIVTIGDRNTLESDSLQDISSDEREVTVTISDQNIYSDEEEREVSYGTQNDNRSGVEEERTVSYLEDPEAPGKCYKPIFACDGNISLLETDVVNLKVNGTVQMVIKKRHLVVNRQQRSFPR